MRALRFILILLFTALPAGVLASEKAKTIDELAQMYDVSSCKECHEKEHEEWSKSLHAISLIGTPRTMITIKLAVADGLMKEQKMSGVKSISDIKKEHLMQCFKCHLPQIDEATDDVVREIAQAAIDGNAEKLKKVNINCLVCHNKKALIHKFHDGEPEKNVVYGSKDGEHGEEKTFTILKRSPIIKEAVFCGQCHGLGPNLDQPNPSQCATLYGSYLHAYVPSGGSQTCQECHMHEFKKGHYMSSYRDPDAGARAVDVVVEAPGYQFLPKPGDLNPTVVLTVKLTSKAGHRIPDG